MSELYLRSHVASGLLVVSSPEQLVNPAILLEDGRPANAPLLGSTQLPNGTWQTRFDASALKTWSPDTPVLYRFVADGVAERFGYCELQPFENKAILVNGSPIYFRGCIRGIAAHEHPNMTGGTRYEADLKYIRQAKKYGFNLVRFHSTIPWPEFVQAADEEGIFIHAEIGFNFETDDQGEKKNLSMDQHNWRDTLLNYRNHPSLAIFCIGNEMHNSGHVPQVHELYQLGRELAPGKIIVDNSGWGEFDRTSADLFSQHIAYFFPMGRHAEMFHVDDPWRINGSAYDAPFDVETQGTRCQATAHRAIVPVRPTIAHEAAHYIEVPDYQKLIEKFEKFAAEVGPEYLEKNGIARPRFMDELPALIQRKGLAGRLPDYIQASQKWKMAALKIYFEECRRSTLCGFEMLQLSDCLKYENKNGILDCFDDDKYIPAKWMRQFNDNAALLAHFDRSTFFYDTPVKCTIYASDFLPQPVQKGDLAVTVRYPDGAIDTLYEGKDITLAGGLQQLATIDLRFAEAPAAAQLEVAATFTAGDLTLANSWKIWGYPRKALPKIPANTFVTSDFDGRVLDALANGQTVLLLQSTPPQPAPGTYFFPGALERCKPCIWDRGSNLGGVIASPALQQALALDKYFDFNLYNLLDGAYKVNLDDFPAPVNQLVSGVDKPVRDRMKGLVHNIKHFIDADTLRNFSHLFSVKVGHGTLVVCTLKTSLQIPSDDPVVHAFSCALLENLAAFADTACAIAPDALRDYLAKVVERGPSKEDTMNHFWEIDCKLVEDTLFWEEAGLDLTKIR